MASSVAVVRCQSYGYQEVEESVESVLSLLGGMQKFVQPGDKVLIKPNLLSASNPSEAITTHPSVVKAVVKQVMAAGGVAIIADSPGGPMNHAILDRAYGKSGWKMVADETGAALNFNTDSVVVSNPEGKIVKRLDVIKILEEVDVVITLPKLKTHMLTKFTGATKILFGVVPGLTKPAYHMKFNDVGLFSEMLIDILLYVKPSLSIMDGVVGLEGDGPGSSGIPKTAGVILGSSDSVALDVVATTVIGMDPLEVPIIQKAVARGLSTGKISDICVLGRSVDEVKVKFRKPSGEIGLIGRMMGSEFLRGLLLKNTLLYPMSNNRCEMCGVCVRNCPAEAITLSGRAYMDLKKCIRCYCCHELCPHKAVELKRNAVGRILCGGV
jgi:uncharacterized protein (DUF362 family)/NAD-dependent dihydropyrimidine dehydrogenase PreA subunit